MITPDFKAVISSENLLRARIMLKDSLVVDPTFAQFDEMLAYTRRERPELIRPHDGEALENDPARWDQELMNLELSQLVGNFSLVRIAHLKQVISQVMAEDIKKLRVRRAGEPQRRTEQPDDRKLRRGHALRIMREEGEKIGELLEKVSRQGRKWKPEQVAQMKQYAQDILKAVKQYEDE